MAIEKIRPRLVDETQDYVFNNVTATGNLTTSNANLGNLATANYVTGTLTTNSQPNITSVGTLGNLSVTGNVATGNLKTDHLLYSNGSPWVMGSTTTAAGSNTQIQFNDSGSFAASANLTFDNTTDTLIVTSIVANGSSLSSLTGANVTGQVANSLIASTVYSSAQPNITSVGTLTTLTVTGNITSGNATLGNLTTSNYFSGNGSLLSSITGANVTGQVNYAAVANSVAGANVTGQVAYAATANAVAGSNVFGQVSNSLVSGTVFTNAQPNITSVGTLSSLTVSANVVAGNIVTDSLLYSNGTAWSLGSGGGSSAPLAMNGDSFVGDGSNVNFTLSVTPSSSYYTIVTIGGVAQPRSFYSVAGNVLTFSTAPPNNTRVDVTTFGGNASYMGIATTVTNSAQPNITSVGTLTSLAVTGNITGNYFVGNGSTLTGVVAATSTSATTAATVTTNAQPNITSVGTLTSLAVTGNVSGSNISGNLYGTGNNISNIQGANVTGAVGLATFATTANAVAGANVSGTVGSATTASTVTTAAQPNITSTGTLTSLTVSGLATLGLTAETFTSLTGAIEVVSHDTTATSTFYHTTPAANFTANFTNVSTTSNKIIVVVLVIAQGSTAYVPTVMQIDGTTQTVSWGGGSAPTGTVNKYDVISYSLFRFASSWTVFGSASSFG